MKQLNELFEELKISPSVYEELMRAKRAGYSFVDDIFQNTEIMLLSETEFCLQMTDMSRIIAKRMESNFFTISADNAPISQHIKIRR